MMLPGKKFHSILYSYHHKLSASFHMYFEQNDQRGFWLACKIIKGYFVQLANRSKGILSNLQNDQRGFFPAYKYQQRVFCPKGILTYTRLEMEGIQWNGFHYTQRGSRS